MTHPHTPSIHEFLCSGFNCHVRFVSGVDAPPMGRGTRIPGLALRLVKFIRRLGRFLHQTAWRDGREAVSIPPEIGPICLVFGRASASAERLVAQWEGAAMVRCLSIACRAVLGFVGASIMKGLKGSGLQAKTLQPNPSGYQNSFNIKWLLDRLKGLKSYTPMNSRARAQARVRARRNRECETGLKPFGTLQCGLAHGVQS
jgi:hypothetical protein